MGNPLASEIYKLADIENIDFEFWQDFVEEVGERLERIESDVLILEHKPDDMDAVYRLYREFHSIKGSAGIVRHAVVQAIAYQTETPLESALNIRLDVDKNIIALVLVSTDYIKKACGNLKLCKNQEFQASIDIHMKKLRDWESDILRIFSAQNAGMGDAAGEQDEEELEAMIHFVIEAKEQLDIIFGQLKAEADSQVAKDSLPYLQKAFFAIANLSEKVRQHVIHKVAHSTGAFLNDSGSFATKEMLLIRRSAHLIRQICEDFEMNADVDFLADVESHLVMLGNIISRAK